MISKTSTEMKEGMKSNGVHKCVDKSDWIEGKKW